MQKSALFKALGLTFGALVISACASKGDVTDGESLEAQALDAGAAAEEAANDVQTQAVNAEQIAAEQAQALAAQAQAALMEVSTFYFDFDQSTMKGDNKDALVAHSKYLEANSDARVVLEGHADERGTVEYNLALGERRALSVSRFLQANGAAAGQIETVSFGEERPAVMGHSDKSWTENRRVEIKYQSR